MSADEGPLRLARLFSRGHLVALLVAAPAVIGACGLSVLEGSRFVQQSSRASTVPDVSFATTIQSGEFEQAFEFVRAGQDPNKPIAFRDEELTGDHEIMITPLLIAVATHRDNAVMMLMSFGARIDAPGNRFAQCLAKYLGDENIAGIIGRDGGPAAAAVTCPETTPSPDAPLLAFAE